MTALRFDIRLMTATTAHGYVGAGAHAYGSAVRSRTTMNRSALARRTAP